MPQDPLQRFEPRHGGEVRPRPVPELRQEVPPSIRQTAS